MRVLTKVIVKSMYALLPCVKERAASEVAATALLHDYGSSVGLQKVETYEPPLSPYLPSSRRFLDRQHLHGGQPAANEVASLCLSLSLWVYLYHCMYPYVCMCVSAVCLSSVCLSDYLSICLYICLCVWLAVCQYMCGACVCAVCLSICLPVPVHINNIN